MAPDTYGRNFILACILKENCDLKEAIRKAKHGHHQNYTSRVYTHVSEAVILSEKVLANQQLLSVQNPDYRIHI